MRRPLASVMAGVALGAGLVACGESSTQTATQKAPRAGELRQPGAPVVMPTVRVVPAPASAGSEGRADGRVLAGGASCGRERWNVKTATDPAAANIVLTPHPTTIEALRQLPTTNPGNPDQPRDGAVESTVYEVTATLVEAKRESDSDFHLVLEDESGKTMIAEVVDAPACTEPPVTAGVSVLERQIEAARLAFVQEFTEPKSYPSPGLKIGHRVTLTGVGFFDVPHGQTGVAPNAIELHPVLSILDP